MVCAMSETDEEVEQWVKSHYETPEIPFKSEDWLWANDWYDGPLSGIMTYRGQLLWFDWIDETDYEVENYDGQHWFSPRVYGVRNLSVTQVTNEIEQRYHCRKLFGNFGDLNIDDEAMDKLLIHFSIEPAKIETKEEYEAAYPGDFDNETFFNYGYRQNRIVGWFVERYNLEGKTRPVSDD
jgi:hypothetical protein